MTERISTSQAAQIVGRSSRWMQSNAASIPGAAKIGRNLTFDEIQLRRWIKKLEVAKCPVIYTSEGKSGGEAKAIMASFTDEAYKQAIGLKPTDASKRGRKKLK